jgi:site-specific DNA-methyltransferase (adenine-specific)
VQVFTFGQHNQHDLGNSHRPLWRFTRDGAVTLRPDSIRVPSWRQLNNDKRADPRGKVPGDCFDFPRVTGNSSQRRKYHPTQLHEGLYERCIKLCCAPGDAVCDIFAGTGTLARVCNRIGNPCTMIEMDRFYCEEIAKEHGLTEGCEGEWTNDT